MTIGDLLFNGGMVAFGGSLVFLFFARYFLNEDMEPHMATFWMVWEGAFAAMILGVLTKYSGRLRMKYSKKKCIKCSKPSAMGSIYCETHLRQANREIAFDQGVSPPEEEDDELGY